MNKYPQHDKQSGGRTLALLALVALTATLPLQAQESVAAAAARGN